MVNKINKNDIIKDLNIDINDQADTIERLFGVCILKEGLEISSRILERYTELKNLIYPKQMIDIKVGTIVKLKTDLLDNLQDSIGVCYELYRLSDLLDNHLGASIIFQNGNYDGFAPDEQQKFLEVIDYKPLNYTFTNVMQLDKDFDKGVFNNHLGV